MAPGRRPVKVNPFSSAYPDWTKFPDESCSSKYIVVPGPVLLALQDAYGFVQVVAKRGSQ